ncbi:SpoIIE family protein phosphatase [Geminocystis sp. NIES-3709]|uniref:ATP-binding SpoIIE family protein phosphatase n=1 Tax=Geminocystis sp. NIES-3709 TaxID=1617448 RepID=UPI0005FCA8C2|nr:SpoIIE family protein phosphatase [Geminocystis sp. NIES-3709]BAQ64634.1 serine phosphatase RsbU [Geminocystis sp. NIES-3709]
MFPKFQFRSITHRLIFGCIVAALLIYSLSYSQMRQVVQSGVVTWMTDVAQSRIDSVAVEIEGILESVQKNSEFVIDSFGSREFDQDSILSIHRLMAEQSIIKTFAIGRFSEVNREYDQLFGLRRNFQTLTELKSNDSIDLLNSCHSNSSHVWLTSKSQNLIYCHHLNSNQTKIPQLNVAIEISLDWLEPLVIRKLNVVDKINHFPIGEPFVIDLSKHQWLVSPSKNIRSLSWFSPEYSTVPEFKSKKNTSQIFTDSQGTLIFTILPKTFWALGIAISEKQMTLFRQNYLWTIILSMTKDMILMCLVIFFISRQTTKSLRALIVSTENIAQGNLNTILPITRQRDEVGRLTKAFHHMLLALKTYIQELQETTAAKQKMESELSIAAQIQRSMIPSIKVIDGSNLDYEISALFQPARLVGGDLYDFFSLGDDRLCIIIGDVADKGVPAALLMARTVTLIRTVTKMTDIPQKILQAVNHELCIDNEECLFVTLFCAVLDLKTGILNYASGGHDTPLLLREGKVNFLELETGPPLGIEEDAFYPEHRYLLKPHDLIVLYTDGITEAMNIEGEFFSSERLIDLLRNNSFYNPARVIYAIEYYHQQFIKEAPQSDDLTLLVLQYHPSNPFFQEINVLQWKITINKELTELDRVKPQIGYMLQKEFITVESIQDTQLIVEEILVNIINYGDNEDPYVIDLEFEIRDKTLTIIFQDSGKPFNPLTEIDPPDLSMDDEREEGGLGFYLVKELAQEIDYIYRNGKNILTIHQNITKKM